MLHATETTRESDPRSFQLCHDNFGFIEVTWLLRFSCQLGSRSNTRDMKGKPVKVWGRSNCAFLWRKYYSYRTRSDWTRPPKLSGKPVLWFEFGEDVSQIQARPVALGLPFCIKLPGLEVLTAGGKLFLEVMRFVRFWELYQSDFWSEADDTQMEVAAWEGGFFLLLNLEVVACGINSAEG